MGEGIWSEFDAAAERLDDDMNFRNVEIYGTTSEYDPDRGKYVDTRGLIATIQAEVREPSIPTYATDVTGTESEVDAVVMIPPEYDGELVAAGGETPATEFVDAKSGKSYDAMEVFVEETGFQRVRARETGE